MNPVSQFSSGTCLTFTPPFTLAYLLALLRIYNRKLRLVIMHLDRMLDLTLIPPFSSALDADSQRIDL